MSELDFAQKVDMRRAFWASGASTRVDVKLGSMVDPARSKTRATSEDWTDLDVLGVQYSPLGGGSFSVADCKTARGRVTERVFWLRGVADLFGAQAAFLTRDSAIPESARQLALRLEIAVMDREDRAAFLEQTGDALLPVAGHFLGPDALQRWTALTLRTPEAISRVQRYRQSHYWLVPRRRNLTALLTTLASNAKAFTPDQRWARAVLIDLAWLYLVAVLSALEDVTRLQLADARRGLTQSVVGSEQDRREKEQLARQLSELFARVDPSLRRRQPNVLPDYFEDLVDLVARASRRRSQITGALRALEFTGVETEAGGGVSWREAFPSADARELKLASDVIRFIGRATQLSSEFVDRFDAATEPNRASPEPTPEPSHAAFVSGEGLVESTESEPSTEQGQESLFPAFDANGSATSPAELLPTEKSADSGRRARPQ